MAESAYSVEKAKSYQRRKQILALARLVLTPALLAGCVLTPISLTLKEWTVGLAGNLSVRVALYFAFFSILMLIFELPPAFYSGYILERRYHLSNQTPGAWAFDFLKKSLLSFALSLALLEILYALIWRFPDSWWVLAWAGYAFFSYALGKLFPVFIVPLFYQYDRLRDESLRKRILHLAGRYSLPVDNVYSLNLSKTTKKANAAFMGLGRTKRVVLSDTLLEHFNHDEIETVVAHELGHFRHRDIWKQLGFGAAASWAAFWISFRILEPAAGSLGFDGAGDVASLPLLFLVFDLFFVILTPLQSGFSRRLERRADLFALGVVGEREVFISCMEKLGKVNLADPAPNPVFEWFFYDHPSVGKRIQMAKEWKGLLLASCFLLLASSPVHADQKSAAAESVEKRQKIELLSFFLQDPEKAQVPATPIAVGLYNQGVEHLKKNDYDLARRAFEDSLRYDDKNALAYERLGDVDYYQQRLADAKAHYETAYALDPSPALKDKIQKLRQETQVEKKLSTYREQHFIIKYHGEEQTLEGFELRELLRETYRNISQDFAYYFKHQVVVLLYDEHEFRQIAAAPHWAAGLYDGKVRMPVRRKGFDEQELRALTAHEVTHAFVAAMSGGGAPAWINEGLAEYEENKIRQNDERIFRQALKSGALLPIDFLVSQNSVTSLRDAGQIQLFYQQSFRLISYLVERYRMFRIKEILAEFGKGKDSDEALRAVLRISPARLEKEWKDTLL